MWSGQGSGVCGLMQYDAKTEHAPQASNVISQRYDADELICLMVIRWERRRAQHYKRKGEKRKRRKKRDFSPPKIFVERSGTRERKDGHARR